MKEGLHFNQLVLVENILSAKENASADKGRGGI